MGAEHATPQSPEEVLPHVEQEADAKRSQGSSRWGCGSGRCCARGSDDCDEDDPVPDMGGEWDMGKPMQLRRSATTSGVSSGVWGSDRSVASPRSPYQSQSRSMRRTMTTGGSPSRRGQRPAPAARAGSLLLELVGVFQSEAQEPEVEPLSDAELHTVAVELATQNSFEYWADRVDYLDQERREEARRRGDSELQEAIEQWSPSIRRKSKRYSRVELLIIGTMERTASQRLQIVIENRRELHELYDVDKKVLGKGSFGSVMRCSVRASGATRAVKKVSKKHVKETIGLLKREISITKMTDHPNIVKLYEIFEDRSHIYFVMELCSGGTLQSCLKAAGFLPEQGVGGAAAVMTQVFRGVYYLHGCGICHRDLKPENFLLTAPESGDARSLMGTIRIADFGISCTFEAGQTLTSIAGTYAYMAPEILDKCYSERCDIWSCGVILYECLCGYPPFSGPDSKSLCRAVRAGRLRFVAQDWADASIKATDFVRDMLRKDYKRRISAEQALKHPWMTQCAPPAPQTQPLSLQLIESLKAFRTLNKFKRAALHVIASLLREDQIAMSREAFNALDVDGDGRLDVEELCQALKASYPYLVREVAKIFEDGKWGVVSFSYTEFIAATFRLEDFDEKICRAAFQTFDHACKGSISIQDIRSGSVLGILRDDDLAQLLREFDLDGDGEVDLHEFKEMLASSLGTDFELPRSATPSRTPPETPSSPSPLGRRSSISPAPPISPCRRSSIAAGAASAAPTFEARPTTETTTTLLRREGEDVTPPASPKTLTPRRTRRDATPPPPETATPPRSAPMRRDATPPPPETATATPPSRAAGSKEKSPASRPAAAATPPISPSRTAPPAASPAKARPLSPSRSAPPASPAKATAKSGSRLRRAAQ